MSILLKIFFFAALFYYGFKMVGKIFLNKLNKKVQNQFEQKKKQDNLYEQTKGDVTVSYEKKDKKNYKDKGEYTDFEELD